MIRCCVVSDINAENIQRNPPKFWEHCSLTFKPTPSLLWPTFHDLDAYLFIHVTIEMSVGGGGGAEADTGKCPEKVPQPGYHPLNCRRLCTATFCKIPLRCRLGFRKVYIQVQKEMEVKNARQVESQPAAQTVAAPRQLVLRFPVSGLWLEVDVKTACRGN